jgi:hypothetical protein
VIGLADLWIALGRITRRRGRASHVVAWDARHRWIAENVRGRSFADIGGLFAISGEFAFAAEEAGASSVTLFDASEASLSDFPDKAAERNSQIETVQGDLEDVESVRQLGPHDIVWCTGVIYHTPNPLLQLMHLREITRERLYLGTYTVPEVPGLPQACLFYPYLPDKTRRAVIRGHQNRPEGLGLGLPFDDHPMRGHGNFWWGITPSALRAMLCAARFEVVEEIRRVEWPFLLDVVARPVDKAPLMPPVSYYRERGEALRRGDEPPPFDGFYDETGRGLI